MATASSSDPVMKSEGSASGGETSEAASTIGMAAAAAALVGKGNNYQQQLMVKYRGIKKSKKDRGCTAKERISKMPPCAAGKRSSIYRGVTRYTILIGNFALYLYSALYSCLSISMHILFEYNFVNGVNLG